MLLVLILQLVLVLEKGEEGKGVVGEGEVGEE